MGQGRLRRVPMTSSIEAQCANYYIMKVKLLRNVNFFVYKLFKPCPATILHSVPKLVTKPEGCPCGEKQHSYSTAVCCFQIVRIFFSKVQTDKMSSDFLTLKIISNQKVDHHVTQCFLEYLLNILCIENCGIFLKEVCDFLNLNFSYFKLFFKNLIQWN